jgi:serine protease Do
VGNVLVELNHDLSSLTEAAQPKVVQVLHAEQGIGSGIIVDASGLVITNAHVVQRSRDTSNPVLSIRVWDGRTAPATVIHADTHSDLALLSVPLCDLHAVELRSETLPMPGEFVTALGFAGGIKTNATSGVVVGTGADLPELAATGREWIAASLRLRPGHSGGPLLDCQGRVIGINTLMAGPDVGAAIPAHHIARFLAAHRPLVPTTAPLHIV